MLSLPLAFYWRRPSLPLLAATLPLLAVNTLSSSSGQQDLNHQYSLPIAVLLVVASLDGFAVDLRQGHLWLTRRLGFCCFWAALCFVVLVNRGHILGYHLISRFDETQPIQTIIRLVPADDREKHGHVPSLRELNQAQALIRSVPADAAVLTQNHLAPHLGHRPVLKVLSSNDGPLLPGVVAEFDVALLDRKSPWDGRRHRSTAIRYTAAAIEKLKDLGWTCDEKSQFVRCQKSPVS